MMTWSQRFRLKAYVGRSLWIIPLGCVVLAVLASIVVPEIDQASESDLTFPYGVGGAIAALSAIAGGMITFTGFVFTILLTNIQFGSSQFSPRLLSPILREKSVKVAFGSFVATFIYALLLLSSVARQSDPEGVPTLSVTFAVLLLLLSVVTFLKLIDQVGHQLRVTSVLSGVADVGRELIDRIYPDPAPPVDRFAGQQAEEPAPGAARTIRHAGNSRILQAADFEGLVETAREADAVVVLIPAIGDYVRYGTPLFEVLEAGAAIDDSRLFGSVAFGDERTIERDLAYVFRMLVDIAERALSPAVNDPTTAVEALDEIEDLLCRLGTRELAIDRLCDTDGHLRVSRRVPGWEDYLSLALTEIRQYGQGSVQVDRRVLAVLETLLGVVGPSRRPAVDEQLRLLTESVQRGFPQPEQPLAAVADRQGIGSPNRVGGTAP